MVFGARAAIVQGRIAETTGRLALQTDYQPLPRRRIRPPIRKALRGLVRARTFAPSAGSSKPALFGRAELTCTCASDVNWKRPSVKNTKHLRHCESSSARSTRGTADRT